MKKGSDTEKGKYVDSLTGRILALLDFVMDPETEDDWLLSKLPGRHGIFDFCETDRINEKSGRPYLEPKCRAEVELAEWIASQGGVRPSQNPHRDEPPIDSYEDEVPY